MKTRVAIVLFILTLVLGAARPAFAAVGVPTLISPAAAANVSSPLTISWSAVTDPSGILGYNCKSVLLLPSLQWLCKIQPTPA